MARSSIDVLMRLRGQKRFIAEVGAASAELQSMGVLGAGAMGKFAAQSQKLKSFGRTMTTRVTLPIVGLAAATGKMAADFEETTAKMEGLVGLDRKVVDGFRRDIKDVSSETAIGANEVADAMFFITSAGLRGKAATEALTFAARGAAIGLGDTQSVADALTSAVNAYGEDVLNSTAATDVLTASVRAGKLEASELAPVVGQVIPLAENMGVSFDQVGGALAVMSKSGTNAARGATSLTSILSTFAKPTSKMLGGLDKMGMSLDEVRDSIAKRGVIDTLVDLRKGAERAGLDLSEVFGNKRAIQGVLQLTGNMKMTRNVMKEVADSAGMTDDAFEKLRQDPGFKMKEAFNDIKLAALELGDVVLPAFGPWFERLGNAIKGAVGWFQKLPDSVKSTLVVVGGIVAAIGPAIWVLGGIAGAVGKFLIVGSKLFPIIKGLAWVTKIWTMALLTNPIFLVIAGLVALTVGLVIAYKKVGWFRAAVDATFRWLKGAVQTVVGFIKDHWKLLIAILLGPIGIAIGLVVTKFNTIRKIVSAVIGFVRKRWKLLIAILGGPFVAAALLIVTNFRKIRSAAGDAINWIRTRFSSLLTFIKGLPGRIGGAARGMFDGIKDAFREAINFIIRAWNSLEFRIPSKKIFGVTVGGGTLSVPKIPEIPGAALGGTVVQAGPVLVGERGPELLELPKAAKVKPLTSSERMRAGGERPVIHTHVYLDRRQIALAVSDEFANAAAAA